MRRLKRATILKVLNLPLTTHHSLPSPPRARRTLPPPHSGPTASRSPVEGQTPGQRSLSARAGSPQVECRGRSRWNSRRGMGARLWKFEKVRAGGSRSLRLAVRVRICICICLGGSPSSRSANRDSACSDSSSSLPPLLSLSSQTRIRSPLALPQNKVIDIRHVGLPSLPPFHSCDALRRAAK